MTVSEYFASLSVETLGLMIAGAGLVLLVIVLQVKNSRMLREVATNQMNLEAKSRIDRLISTVENLNSSAARPHTVRARPLNKSRKVVPAIRSSKVFLPRQRIR